MFSVSCGGTSCSSMGSGGGAFGRWLWWWRWITPPQMMCCPAHISMNASLSHYLYIMATTPRRGQASSRLISPLTARPEEKWEARKSCSPLIHRHHLTPQPWIACSRHYGFCHLYIHDTIVHSRIWYFEEFISVSKRETKKRYKKVGWTIIIIINILGFCWKEGNIPHYCL